MFPIMHSKEFQCPVCAKYFSRKFTLDAHMLIHKGEKPHTCQFCGKCFRQKGTLMRHKALHSAKYLFHCSLCKQGFRQKNVFIFHLRHRHNVSTETLDRRKYRTEPKDYQSIMDTLPPFVQVDSTAIASSGEHFDAMLYESIQKPVKDAEMLQCGYTVGNNMQDSNASFSNKNISHEDHGDFGILKSRKCTQVYKENCRSSLSSSSSNINEVENAELFPRKSCILPTNTVIPDTIHVISLDEEPITCMLCQLTFPGKVEFKYHMKDHAIVFPSDVNTSVQTSNTSDVQSNVSRSSDCLVTEEESVNNTDLQNDNEMKFPIKTEILDFEIDSCSSLHANNAQISEGSSFLSKNKSPYNQYKLKCPVCNVCLNGDTAFKKHSKKHDSYLLLKLIYNSMGSKNDFYTHQNNFLSVTGACSDNLPRKHFIKDSKKLQQKFHNTDVYYKKSSNQTKSLSTKNKSPFKRFMCMQCDKKFPNKFLLEYHRQLHLSTRGFVCRCCRNSFWSKKLLLSHTRLHHMKTFACSKCSRVFSYHRLYSLHQKVCSKRDDTKTLNGSCINFPIVNIESFLKSDVSGIIGIIPVSTESGEKKKLELGIPVMSISQIKTQYMI